MGKPLEPTPIEIEEKVLAQIARGDTQTAIAKEYGLTKATVTHIKQRNEQLLAKMNERVENYRAKKAEQILDKSQDRLLKQLNSDDYEIKPLELNAISKTAYDQLRLEQGKATSISATAPVAPEQATKENLEQLVEAIKNGNEIELQRLIFKQKQ